MIPDDIHDDTRWYQIKEEMITLYFHWIFSLPSCGGKHSFKGPLTILKGHGQISSVLKDMRFDLGNLRNHEILETYWSFHFQRQQSIQRTIPLSC